LKSIAESLNVSKKKTVVEEGEDETFMKETGYGWEEGV
jgi:hypothetical protein